MHDTSPAAPAWGVMSPADFDRRRVAKGHKAASGDQASLFYIPAPTADRKLAPAREELPGQESLFGPADGEATP